MTAHVFIVCFNTFDPDLGSGPRTPSARISASLVLLRRRISRVFLRVIAYSLSFCGFDCFSEEAILYIWDLYTYGPEVGSP